jgi:hypothetical protein
MAVTWPTPAAIADPNPGTTIATARAIIRASARNGTDTSMYTELQVDYALAGLLSRFCRKTHYLRSSATASVSTSTGAFTIAAITNWPTLERQNIISVTSSLDGALLPLLDWSDMVQHKLGEGTGYPEVASLFNGTTGYAYPTPTDTCNVFLEFWYHCKRWTLGDAGATIITLPPQVLDEILPVGGPWQLHQHEPEHAAFAEAMRAKYLQIEAEYRNASASASYATTR